MRKKKATTKTEIQINEEPKLRIKSDVTIIIIALDKGQKAAINFLTHLKVIYYQCRDCLSSLLF